MIKTGRVELKKTPSIVSGKPAEIIVDDEPLCEDEIAQLAPTIKLASVFKTLETGI